MLGEFNGVIRKRCTFPLLVKVSDSGGRDPAVTGVDRFFCPTPERQGDMRYLGAGGGDTYPEVFHIRRGRPAVGLADDVLAPWGFGTTSNSVNGFPRHRGPQPGRQDRESRNRWKCLPIADGLIWPLILGEARWTCSSQVEPCFPSL